MVGTFREPSCGRSVAPIHSIPYSVAQPLERGSNNYYSIIQGYTFHAKAFCASDDDLKWVHIAISNLKAFLLGTYHGRAANLQAYLNEFCFRYNRRWFPHQLFARTLAAIATSCVQLT